MKQRFMRIYFPFLGHNQTEHEVRGGGDLHVTKAWMTLGWKDANRAIVSLIINLFIIYFDGGVRLTKAMKIVFSGKLLCRPPADFGS